MPFMAPFSAPLASVAHVGTFPPTQCGLATFGAALVDALTLNSPGLAAGIVDVTEREQPLQPGVQAQWRHGDRASLQAAVDFVDCHDAVIVEHEFGIYGGRDGDEVLSLVEAVCPPVLTVLHTVLASPTPHQRSIIEMLAYASEAVVVMTCSARDRLVSTHAIDPRDVYVIPHGAHPNLDGREPARGGRATILTWGLLGPGKGIEAGIDAMRRLSRLIPAPRYVVAGTTRPKVLARSGEEYRRQLVTRADGNGVGHLVHFDDNYRDVESLKRLIRSADVVLLPYETRDQVTSGVLMEAVASGRPVVATDFPHARELLSGGAGIVIPHDDVDALADAVETILAHPRLADQMHREAVRLGAPMLWPTVGRRYLDVLQSITDLRPPWRSPVQVA
jgi:glycosyltransferase involved in cell wall biosynthesis